MAQDPILSLSTRAVLVTGAAGFIGARFVEASAKRGVPVISVDRPEHFRDRSEHAGVPFGPIINREELDTWLSALKPGQKQIRAIVHLGACTKTTEFDATFLKRVNLDYSIMLWGHATRLGVPLVYASSAATYGDGAGGYRDDESAMHALKPLNPYGQSKLDFDLWVLASERTSRPPSWAGFKFFNVYGFGERHKDTMASMVTRGYDQLRAHGRTTLFRSHRPDIADGGQSRDFVWVDDVVDVLLFALEKPIPRGIFNLGSGKARSFLDLTLAVFRELGETDPLARGKITWVDTPLEIRDKYQYFTEADLTKLRAAGYLKPFTSLEDGVRQTLERLQKRPGPVHT